MADFISEETISTLHQVQYDAYYGSERLENWRRLGAFTKADNILQLCRSHAFDHVIDIGCGNGAVLQRLDELGFAERYCGLEISTSAIASLEQKEIRRLDAVKQFNGYDIPFEDKSFDLAILSHVIEHVEHPRRLLYEASRVARYIFVEVPLEHTARLMKDYDHDPVGHINYYTEKTIRLLLQTSGFKVIDQNVTDVSREMLTFQHGKKGLLRHYARRLALKTFPASAKRVFVYHSALLCECP